MNEFPRSSGGAPQDGRSGSSTAISAVASSCRKALGSSSGTFYDCAGRADALPAAAG